MDCCTRSADFLISEVWSCSTPRPEQWRTTMADTPPSGQTHGTSNGHGELPTTEGTAPGLTTRQGHPVSDNQNNLTVGERGPTVLENYHFLEKISHFDRERIPER